MFISNLIKVLAFAAVAVASVTNAQVGEPIAGEATINVISVHPRADSYIAEAYTMWGSKGWSLLSNSSGIINETKMVSGVFAATGVNVTRGSAVVDAPAQKVFDYLITPVGFQVIDPLSNPEDFSKPPLADYPVPFWRGIGNTDKKSLKVERTVTAIPGIRPREFVVLNMVDQLTRIFVSKSIQNVNAPGCSQYGGASCFNATAIPVRALNTFAVEVQPLAGNKNKSVVRLINFADLMRGEFPVEVQNQFNVGFIPDLVMRLRAVFPTVV